MKLITFLFLFSSSIFYAGAQEKSDPWTKYMSPGRIHNLLSAYEGQFGLQITMWMSPGEEPKKMQLGASGRMILGGRFLEMTQQGNMEGMNYEAVTTLGFNNSGLSFESSSITNIGTGMLFLSGTWDEKTKTATVRGILNDPVSNEPISVRQTIELRDNDTLIISNFDKRGNEAEQLTIRYTFLRRVATPQGK